MLEDKQLDISMFLKELAKGAQHIDRYGIFTHMPDYNPDALAGKKGIETYSEMPKRDGQIKSCLLFKKYARLSTGGTLHPASKDPQDIEVRDFWKYNFDNMQGTIEGAVEDLMRAYDLGFAAVEIVLEPITEGPFAGKWGVKRLKAKRQKDIHFKNDEFGNLDEQTGLNQFYEGKDHPLPLSKFMVYTHNMEDDNHYGVSDLRAAYRYYFFKDLVERYWTSFLEDFGGPIVQGKYPAGSTPAKIKEIWNTVKQFMKAKRILHPSDWEVTLIQAAQQSGGTYDGALTYFNKMEARAILVPSLLQDQDSNVGSYAMSQTRVGSFVWILKHDGASLEEVVNEQLIRRITRLNYPVTSYPKWRFKSFQEEDLAGIGQTLTGLVDRGMKISQEYVYERFGIPEPEKDDELLEPSKPEPPALPPARGNTRSFPPFKSSAKKPVVDEKGEPIEMADATPPGCHRPPTEFEEKVDWGHVDVQEQAELEASAGRIGLVVGAMRDIVVEEVQKKKRSRSEI